MVAGQVSNSSGTTDWYLIFTKLILALCHIQMSPGRNGHC